MRETSGCFKGPYDSSYASPIFTEEKSEKLGRVPTEMELILEHTQQGISYEVSVSAEGVEELKTITLSFPSHKDYRKYKEEDEMKMRNNLRERNKLKQKVVLTRRKNGKPTLSPRVKGYLYKRNRRRAKGPVGLPYGPNHILWAFSPTLRPT
nr:hypothetical protein [Tanacetum cinerariifolium]